MTVPFSRSSFLKSLRRKRRNFASPKKRFLSIEILELRQVFCVEEDLEILPGHDPDPALLDVEPHPPGPDTGPTPVGYASYTTLANGMPVLDSWPNAPTAIFLDFDGDTSGSNPYTGNVTPYSEDADGTTFNVSEQRNIYEAWREVSSYYAIFDVNVTTVPPPAGTPIAWLAVGNNISGGYSYVNVFPNSTPESWNNSGDARTRVSGIAHELGHNFGLQHQSSYDQWGVKSAEYAGAPDALHGSIMGVDYAGTIHKFIIGHNSTSIGATTLQDDIALIADVIAVYQPSGGDGFRADDFNDTFATATALPTVGASQWTPAIIERLDDRDVFSFTSTGGWYGISAAPDAPSGVDLKLEIYAANGTLIAAKDGANNAQQLSLSLGSGTYYATVSSHGNYGDVGSYFMSVSALPAGWNSVDVGTGVSGYTVYDNATGIFNPVGTGVGLVGLADGFQYAHQTLNGDGSIIAKVANVDNTSTNALAGVTIRETTDVNSRHVSVAVTSGAGPKLFSRTTTGSGTTTTTGSVGAHRWVKLSRSGNVFTAFTSSDGGTWTQLGAAVTASMANSVTVGLLTASANNHALNVGQLESVTLTGNLGSAPPTYNGLSAPAGVSVARGAGSNLNLAWNSVGGATGYVVDRSTDGVNFSPITNTTSTSFVDANLVGSMLYFYRVSATDGTGRSTPSLRVSAVNRPSAVTNLEIVSPSATQLVLNWRETTGETGYRIERSTNGGATFSSLTTVDANVPSYTDAGLTSGVAYAYRVVPTSDLGDGGVSTTVSGAPRLGVVNPTLGTVEEGSISLNWTDLANETGYRIERSTNGSTFTTLATVAANTASYADTTVSPAGEYYYRVFGTTALTQSLIGPVRLAAAPSASPPSAPWTSQDLGSVAGPGTTDLTSNTFTIVSSGVDIGGASDSFRFSSQDFAGDGAISARVATTENTGANAEVGVMIRQSTAVNAANAFVYVTPTAIGFSYRSSAGGATTTVATAALTAPQWVKLVRSGNSFAASYSSNGTTWTALGSSVTISMTGTAKIGLAATANSTALLNTSTVTNVDVVTSAGFNVSAPSAAGTTTEAGGTVTFTVSLTSAPTANVSIPLSSSNTSEGTVSPTTLFFTPTNWSSPQTVTVTGVDDAIDDGNVNYTIVLDAATSSDANYHGRNPTDVALINQDDDTAGFTLANQSGATTSEGGQSVTFTLRLTSEPTADVTIGVSSSNSAEGIVGPASLVFTSTNWNTPQTVTVTGVDDLIDDGSVGYSVVLGAATSTDAKYGGLNPADLNLTNLDDDMAGLTVSNPSGTLTSEAGQAVTFTIRLNTRPTANVTIPVSSSDGTEGTVSPTSLVFTALNWDTPQTITVTGTDDFLDDGDVNYTAVIGAAVSTDLTYHGLNPADVSLTNQDDDTAGITVSSPSSATTSEGGQTATFTIRLDSQPTANVTIPLSSSDLTEGTVSPSSLVFTSSNWSTPQTVTATGVNDTIADGDIAYTIVIGAATSTDALYSGRNPADLGLTNTDDDPVISTKFYVVNDGSPDRTYEYSANAAAVENYAINSGNTAPRGIATTAAGDTFWVLDKNRKVYVYNDSGVLQRSWTAGTIATNATVEGIATDGTDVWIVDSRSDKIYYYPNAANAANGATVVSPSSFKLNSANANPKDIVTDGASLWVVNDASKDMVFKYSLTGVLQSSWTINAANKAPTGITLDPSNGSQDLWIVDSGTDRVYRYASGRILAAPVLSDSFVLSTGNSSPQGIADPPPRSLGQAQAGLPSVPPSDAPAVASASLCGLVAQHDAVTSRPELRARLLSAATAESAWDAREDWISVISQVASDATRRLGVRSPSLGGTHGRTSLGDESLTVTEALDQVFAELD